MVTCVRKRAATRTQAPAGILLKRNSSTPTTRVVGSCRVVHACYIGRMKKKATPKKATRKRRPTRAEIRATDYRAGVIYGCLDALREAWRVFLAAGEEAAAQNDSLAWRAVDVAEQQLAFITAHYDTARHGAYQSLIAQRIETELSEATNNGAAAMRGEE